MSIPTPEQVQEELQKLKELAPRIKQRSFFGDDNRAKIDAQIAVLSGLYVDEESEEFEDGDNDIYEAARLAHDWHQYIRLNDGAGDSITHDPDCPCGKEGE